MHCECTLVYPERRSLQEPWNEVVRFDFIVTVFLVYLAWSVVFNFMLNQGIMYIN